MHIYIYIQMYNRFPIRIDHLKQLPAAWGLDPSAGEVLHGLSALLRAGRHCCGAWLFPGGVAGWAGAGWHMGCCSFTAFFWEGPRIVANC